MKSSGTVSCSCLLHLVTSAELTSDTKLLMIRMRIKARVKVKALKVKDLKGKDLKVKDLKVKALKAKALKVKVPRI